MRSCFSRSSFRGARVFQCRARSKRGPIRRRMSWSGAKGLFVDEMMGIRGRGKKEMGSLARPGVKVTEKIFEGSEMWRQSVQWFRGRSWGIVFLVILAGPLHGQDPDYSVLRINEVIAENETQNPR